MSIDAAMTDACRAIGIVPPHRTAPGRWVQCPAEGKSRNNGAGRVMIDADRRRGIAWNWITGERRAFSDQGATGEAMPPRQRDPEADRRREAERAEVEAICGRIVAACRHDRHPYLAAKGFPDEIGLVIDDPRAALPATPVGRAVGAAMPEGEGPVLIIPGRIGTRLRTVQFILADGTKKNILRGHMRGCAHRLSAGGRVVICEGIATALSVRAALRLLGARCEVLSAFAAANVATVAEGIPGALVLADHDAPLEQLGGLGTGEFYARRAGRAWAMPPEPGDYNDWHQRAGLRALSLHLREVLAR